MPTIPRFGPEVATQAAPTVRQNPNLPIEAFGGGQAAAGLAAVGKVVQDYAAEQREKASNAAMTDATNGLWESQRRVFLDPEKGYLRTKGKDAIGGDQAALAAWDADADRIQNGLPKHLREQFRAIRLDKRRSLEGSALAHLAQQSEEYNKVVLDAGFAAAQEEAFEFRSDPQRIAALSGQVEGMVRGSMPRESEEAIGLAVREQTSKLHVAVISGLINDDPFAAIQYLTTYGAKLTVGDRLRLQTHLQPFVQDRQAEEIANDALTTGTVSTTFSGIDEVVAQTEGGYVGNDGGKGPTNFGINSAANPDVDVANLSPEAAQAIRKSRYWDEIGADSLPLAVRGQAYDAAINQGVPWTQKALKESGGDPVVFAQMRRDRYHELANANPAKYGKYLRGWLSRVDRMTAASETQGDSPKARALAAVGQVQNPVLKAKAEAKVRDALAVEAAQKQERDEAISVSINRKLAGAVPGTPLRNVLDQNEYQWAIDTGRLKSYESELIPGKRDENTHDIEALGFIQQQVFRAASGDKKAREFIAKLDPYDPKIPITQSQRKSLADDVLAIRKDDPAKVADIQFVGDVIEQAMFAAFGDVSAPKGSTEAARRADFTAVLTKAIQGFKTRTGKEPTQADVQRMSDTLLFKGEGDKRLFQGGVENPRELHVPANVRREIYRTIGNDATEAEVISAYAEWKRRKGK